MNTLARRLSRDHRRRHARDGDRAGRLLVAAGRLTRRIGRFVDDVEREVKPILGHLNAITRDASRAAALAVAQVERVDAACAPDVAAKIDQTITTIHSAIVKPAREGRALVLGFQAMHGRDPRVPQPPIARRTAATRKTASSFSSTWPPRRETIPPVTEAEADDRSVAS